MYVSPEDVLKLVKEHIDKRNIDIKPGTLKPLIKQENRTSHFAGYRAESEME